jgi:endonuclease/exonuclease/phosphatase family metal-dependent hydrolase
MRLILGLLTVTVLYATFEPTNQTALPIPAAVAYDFDSQCEQDECRLTVFNYNVRGIFVGKEGLESRKLRFPKIAPRLADADIVFLQEFFLKGKPDDVTSDLLERSPQRAHLLAPFEKQRYYNSGLAILHALPEENVVATEFEPYDECHGDLLPISNGNDCMARKGVLFARLSLPVGEIDLYTSHTEAGSSERDREVKTSHQRQLGRMIERLSGTGEEGRALILAGDLNARLDGVEPQSVALIEEVARLGLVNVNDQVSPDFGRCPDWDKCSDLQIDYVFVRNSAQLELGAETVVFDQLLDPESGQRLSDHPLIAVDLVVRRR